MHEINEAQSPKPLWGKSSDEMVDRASVILNNRLLHVFIANTLVSKGEGIEHIENALSPLLTIAVESFGAVENQSVKEAGIRSYNEAAKNIIDTISEFIDLLEKG